MKTSTALTLAASAAIVTAAAFVHRSQNADLAARQPDEVSDSVSAPQAGSAPGATASPPVAGSPSDVAGEPLPRPGSASATGPSPFRVAGVLVQRELLVEGAYGSKMPFPGSTARVRLCIEYTNPLGNLIDWQRDDCSLSVFADDRGEDLLIPDDFPGPFEMMPSISKDGTSLAFNLQSDRGLSSGAQSIRAEGEVVLRFASEQATHSSKVVRLEPDANISCGPFQLQIGTVGPANWSDGWEISFETTSDLSAVVEWAFEDPEGQRIPLDKSSSISGSGYWHQSVTAPKELDRGKLVVTCWSDVRVESVPFSVEARLGF